MKLIYEDEEEFTSTQPSFNTATFVSLIMASVVAVTSMCPFNTAVTPSGMRCTLLINCVTVPSTLEFFSLLFYIHC